jgi:hypothetical protein
MSPNPMKAYLTHPIPEHRMRLVSGKSMSRPRVGDIGETDHCYTGDDGEQMVMVYFINVVDGSEWEVEAYESELEPVSPWSANSTNTVFYYVPNE